MKKKETPDRDELVIATVKKILPYGAFCNLDEYGKEAFLHISEVAPRWIKNIHNFLKEGQRIVGRVYRLVPEKNLIDISIKRVTDADKKRKTEAYRREKRSMKLLEVIMRKIKKPKMKLEDVWDELEKKYEEVYSGLEEAATNGKVAFKNTQITEDWQNAIVEIAAESIKKQKKKIGGILTITSNQPDGIEVIKKALSSVDVSLSYLGAPRYMVSVEGDEYKECEKKLQASVDKITKELSKKGTCKFERKESEK